MALNKQFIHFQTKSAFNKQKENISDTSIAFIKETGEIYTHDKLYGSISIASSTANGLMPKEHYSIIDKESNNQFVTELSNNVSTTADKVYIQYKSRYFGDDLKHDNICNILSATSTNAGVMSATDKRKLDSLSNYTLPTANSSTLGGIKIGSGLNIDSNGTVSVDNKLYILVNSLESVTTPDANKIYLVLNSSSTSETNSFTEYVWITSDTGGKWEKLGEASATVDLANYYTKTEIDNKLSPINESITNLDTNKVDKVEGKGLSTHDFNDSYKSYLDVLGNRSFGNSISYTSSDNEPDILKINLRGITGIANDTKTLSSITIPLATTSKCGLMSMKDKYIVNNALIEVPKAAPQVTGGVAAKIGDLNDMVNVNGPQPTVTYNYQRKLFMVEVDRNSFNEAFIPIPVPDVATTAKNGLLSKEDKVKLDSIETGANKYVLPEAGNNTLGGIKAPIRNAYMAVDTINNKYINEKAVYGSFSYHTGMEQVLPTYYQVLEATTEKYGLMSPEDKVKLDNINVSDFAVDLTPYAKTADVTSAIDAAKTELTGDIATAKSQAISEAKSETATAAEQLYSSKTSWANGGTITSEVYYKILKGTQDNFTLPFDLNGFVSGITANGNAQCYSGVMFAVSYANKPGNPKQRSDTLYLPFAAVNAEKGVVAFEDLQFRYADLQNDEVDVRYKVTPVSNSQIRLDLVAENAGGGSEKPWLEVNVNIDDLSNALYEANGKYEIHNIAPEITDFSQHCGVKITDKSGSLYYFPFMYHMDDRSDAWCSNFQAADKTWRVTLGSGVSSSIIFDDITPAKKTDVETALSGKVDNATFEAHKDTYETFKTNTEVALNSKADIANTYNKAEVDAKLTRMVKIQKLTQEEYDALETKDENVLYAIIEPATEG